MSNKIYMPMWEPMQGEHCLDHELEELRFQMMRPEEYKRQQEEQEKAREKAKDFFRQRIEAAKHLPENYFDGWEVYEVKKGDRLWDIAEKCLGSGTRQAEIMRNNDQQLPCGPFGIRAGTKLRIKRI